MRSTISSPESLLKKGLKELSLAHSAEQIRAFMAYLSELKKWNKAYNLTSLKTDEDIIIKHFLDSLLYLEAIPEGEVSVMDVGSGAGFPGIPIKIIRPEITVYLAEPSRKKAGFLRHVIGVLGLQSIEVVEKRIEEIKSLMVDVAVTRALFDIKDFYRKAIPLLKEGGRLVVSKGPKVNEELKAVKNMDYEVLTLTLPLSTTKRFIVVITKGDQETKTAEKPNSAALNNVPSKSSDICVNAECRLRKAGCRGFEGCPGFKARG
ncbi:MAG: 16S rRNA (guanine(527)-N(7))-methyltransferase RsmG [Nitrospirae bacterium]|nr:16S rRNA (guanine(527)-N(7))-methyltransferase RsmG [Nitrospirota bacterium]